jgi:hypothetical protein
VQVCDGMSDSQTIYLGVNDDIAAVIDHLTAVDAGKVFFVVPKDAEIFSSIVNLKLLKREAASQNKVITLVTSDKMGRYLAQRAEIPFKDESEHVEQLQEEQARKAPAAIVEEKIILKEKPIIKERIMFPEEKKMPAPKSMADIVALPKAAQQGYIPAAPAGAALSTFQEEKILPRRRDGASYKEETPIVNEETKAHFEQPKEDLYAKQEESRLEIAVEEPEPLKAAPAPVEQEVPIHYQEEAFSQPVQEPMPYQAPAEYHPRTFEGLERFRAIEKPEAVIGLGEERRRSGISSKKVKKIIFLLLGLGLITFILAAYFILPEAKLVITPKRDSSSLEISVVADKNLSQIDYALLRVPAKLMKIEKDETKEFASSGESQTSAKAKGIITVSNGYSAETQTLVATTRFETDDGKIFRTTKTIVVPGAKIQGSNMTPGSIDVEVIADQPGSSYNIGPTLFTIPGFKGSPKYDGFNGKSSAPLAGGSDGKTKMVIQSDLDNAKNVMTQKFKDELDQSLKDQISSDLKLLNGALKENQPEITFSQQAGNAADKFTATIKLTATALVFETKDIADLAGKAISTDSSSNKQLLPNEDFAYSDVGINFDLGQINMKVRTQQGAVNKIDIDALAKQLAGKDEIGIKKVLSQMPEIQNAKITFWPFWVKKVPNEIDKIKISVE